MATMSPSGVCNVAERRLTRRTDVARVSHLDVRFSPENMCIGASHATGCRLCQQERDQSDRVNVAWRCARCRSRPHSQRHPSFARMTRVPWIGRLRSRLMASPSPRCATMITRSCVNRSAIERHRRRRVRHWMGEHATLQVSAWDMSPRQVGHTKPRARTMRASRWVIGGDHAPHPWRCYDGFSPSRRPCARPKRASSAGRESSTVHSTRPTS